MLELMPDNLAAKRHQGKRFPPSLSVATIARL
jgi:hypothetical protein